MRRGLAELTAIMIYLPHRQLRVLVSLHPAAKLDKSQNPRRKLHSGEAGIPVALINWLLKHWRKERSTSLLKQNLHQALRGPDRRQCHQEEIRQAHRAIAMTQQRGRVEIQC